MTTHEQQIVTMQLNTETHCKYSQHNQSEKPVANTHNATKYNFIHLHDLSSARNHIFFQDSGISFLVFSSRYVILLGFLLLVIVLF